MKGRQGKDQARTLQLAVEWQLLHQSPATQPERAFHVHVAVYTAWKHSNSESAITGVVVISKNIYDFLIHQEGMEQRLTLRPLALQ